MRRLVRDLIFFVFAMLFGVSLMSNAPGEHLIILAGIAALWAGFTR